ncbi:MAG: lipid-A-disaccharide synthase, partial [Phycisphaeraceae bacterium]
AAAVVRELKRHHPEVRLCAMGGPAMAAAGAELIEHTTGEAVMLADSVRQAMAHRARLRRLRAWMAANAVDAVVPVDSPAANWGVCRLTRGLAPEARIVHLVMPQLWAWASWRLNKLRRLSDHVLCLLPFEEQWLRERGIEATFVGHPLYELGEGAFQNDGDDPAEGSRTRHPRALGGDERNAGGVRRAHADLPRAGEPKVALLPGSRGSEVKANWPTMRAAWEILRSEFPGMVACVAASDAQREAQLRAELAGGDWPEGMHVVTGDATAVLDWSDAALVVSGTATLHAASRGAPMVVLYNVSRWSWHLLGRWLVSTRTFSLPNLIGEHLGLGRVVPELVPHFGEVAPVVEAMRPLMEEGEARAGQRAAFERIAGCFAGRGFAAVSAKVLLEETRQVASLHT